jgi:hypothetical protein
LLQPGGVVALPGDAVTAVQLQNPAGDVVQEIAIVGDGDDRAAVLLQVPFQPGHGLGIQVVGRLVQQQDVGRLEQQPAQGHPPPLAAGEDGDRGVRRRAAQGVHGQLQAAVQVPGVEVVQLILQFALALDEPVHLLGRQLLGKAGVDLVVLAQGIDDLLHAFLNDLADGLVESSSSGSCSRKPMV